MSGFSNKFNMTQASIGNITVLTFYMVFVGIGFLCSKPKVAFYSSVGAALVACVVLFKMKVYLEMGGLLHTVPFAIVPFLICRFRKKREMDRGK